MASTRNTILNHVKTEFASVPGLHTERIKIGAVLPSKMLTAGGPIVWLTWGRDTGERKDGGKTTRMLTLIVSTIVKLDDLKAESQLEQLSEIYDAVHAKLETIADAAVGGLASYMKEEPGGVQPAGYDDLDSYASISSAWTIEYDRTLGTP